MSPPAHPFSLTINLSKIQAVSRTGNRAQPDTRRQKFDALQHVVRSILGGLIPQLAAACATSASVRGDIDPPTRRRNRKIHLREIFLTHWSKTVRRSRAPLCKVYARAHIPTHTVNTALPIIPSPNKVSTGSRLEPLPTTFTARKVYRISHLHRCVKVVRELFALDYKRIADQARFDIPTALTVILRSRMVQLTVRQF